MLGNLHIHVFIFSKIIKWLLSQTRVSFGTPAGEKKMIIRTSGPFVNSHGHGTSTIRRSFSSPNQWIFRYKPSILSLPTLMEPPYLCWLPSPKLFLEFWVSQVQRMPTPKTTDGTPPSAAIAAVGVLTLHAPRARIVRISCDSPLLRQCHPPIHPSIHTYIYIYLHTCTHAHIHICVFFIYLWNISLHMCRNVYIVKYTSKL